MEPSIIVGIVVLAVGVVAVVVSFFLTDSKNKSADELTEDGKTDIERQLDEYCRSLVEQKKKELSAQGDKARSDMKKSFDDALTDSRKEYDKIKSDSKKSFDDMKAASQKEMDELIEKAAKQFDDMRTDTEKKLDDMHESSAGRVEAALKAYEDSMARAKEKMEKELRACADQLSEKAKKQMIDYINKSLSEAYEAYDPNDKSEKEPITYDEPEQLAAEDSAGDVSDVSDGAEDETVSDADKAEAPENSENADSAFTVVTEEALQKSEESGQAAGSAQTASDRPRNNRSKKKKKKKPEQKKAIDIWDEGADTDTRVAELHKKGLSIMEIANRLGLGVGEVKTTIDRIEKSSAGGTDKTGKNGENN